MYKIQIQYNMQIDINEEHTLSAVLTQIQKRYYHLFPEFIKTQYATNCPYVHKTIKEINPESKTINIICSFHKTTAELENLTKQLSDANEQWAEKCADLQLEIQKMEAKNIEYEEVISYLNSKLQKEHTKIAH